MFDCCGSSPRIAGRNTIGNSCDASAENTAKVEGLQKARWAHDLTNYCRKKVRVEIFFTLKSGEKVTTICGHLVVPCSQSSEEINKPAVKQDDQTVPYCRRL